MSHTLSADAELDARTLACPMPLLKTRQALRLLSSGQVLYVQVSDPGALRDIPAWVRQAGHELVQQQQHEGVVHFWIRCV